MYNNARDRDSNSRCNYCGNFRKCRLITRHQFSSTNHCTRRAFGWRIAAIRSRRNRSRIRYRLSTNWKIIRAVVNACPAIFRRSQCIRTERHLFVWEDRNPPRWTCKSRNVQFLIYLGRDTTPIYRGLHLEIWKNQWILILHNFFSENSFQFCLWCYRHVW